MCLSPFLQAVLLEFLRQISWSWWRYSGISVALMVACILPSCRGQVEGVSQVHTSLGWLGSMYAMYAAQNQGSTPKTMDDLRKFVEKKTTAEQLARLKVANVGELFVSSRDGKPFAVVAYATLPAPAAGQPPPVVLYESVGQGGRRAIAYLGGATDTIDETQLPKLLPAQSKTTK